MRRTSRHDWWISCGPKELTRALISFGVGGSEKKKKKEKEKRGKPQVLVLKQDH